MPLESSRESPVFRGVGLWVCGELKDHIMLLYVAGHLIRTKASEHRRGWATLGQGQGHTQHLCSQCREDTLKLCWEGLSLAILPTSLVGSQGQHAKGRIGENEKFPHKMSLGVQGVKHRSPKHFNYSTNDNIQTSLFSAPSQDPSEGQTFHSLMLLHREREERESPLAPNPNGQAASDFLLQEPYLQLELCKEVLFFSIFY